MDNNQDTNLNNSQDNFQDIILKTIQQYICVDNNNNYGGYGHFMHGLSLQKFFELSGPVLSIITYLKETSRTGSVNFCFQTKFLSSSMELL